MRVFISLLMVFLCAAVIAFLFDNKASFGTTLFNILMAVWTLTALGFALVVPVGLVMDRREEQIMVKMQSTDTRGRR